MPVAMAVAWQALLPPSPGLANTWLSALALTPCTTPSDRHPVICTLAAIGARQGVGYNLALFLASLAAIPRAMRDAVQVDGAGQGWARFPLVRLPLSGPTTRIAPIVTAAGTFRMFETVAVLKGRGPAFPSDTIVRALYREDPDY